MIGIGTILNVVGIIAGGICGLLFGGFLKEKAQDTGYTFEELNELQKEILNYCDILVDGPYIEKLRDLRIDKENKNLICSIINKYSKK